MRNLLRHAAQAAAMAAVAVMVLAACGCSTKKNTAASRNYQAFITRYNVYFNGDEHYKETLKAMENSYEDDYSATLFTHPAEAHGAKQAPQPSGDFTRSIEKAQKAIQLHSIKKRPKRKPGKGSDPAYKAWLKRDEYNPFLHNAWMMMGRSQYMGGDFMGAASTFYYISKHFTWLPATVTEAKLWQARSYIALDWLFEAETVLSQVKEKDLTSSTLRNLNNLVRADFYVRSAEYAQAIPYLEAAAATAKGTQKARLYFLLGQAYTRTGDKQRAYAAFGKVAGSGSAPYRTQFNARIRQSEVYSGANVAPEVNALKRMTRYDRNKEYLDQIYYAIGNLYMSRQDTAKAIPNYILAAEKSTRNGIDKAISQITLGEIYFAQGKYDLAQPRYAEALPQLPDNYPNYDTLKRRSDVLDEMAVYSHNVVLQDSLLRLSAMTDDERMAVINRIIDELNKREREEAEAAKREAYLAEQQANGQQNRTNANTPNSFTLNTDDSWYFYNSATVASGRTEFQRRWGSRKLEDDWRRRNKASFSFDEIDNNSPTEASDSTATNPGDTELTPEQKKAADEAKDPHYPAYYLAQIPMTDQDKTTAHDVIQDGLYNMGLILKDKLEDNGAARTQWERLLTEYPDNVYRLDTYYNLYLMYMRAGDTAEAERWRQLIISEFADSKYGMALQDPDYIKNLREMPARQQAIYDDAYAAYLENRNEEVHGAYEKMMRDYPLSEIMPKFMFLHALAYVTEKKPQEFAATLRELLERYPQTDVTPLASAYLKGVQQGRKLNESTGNVRGMLWDIRLTNDTTANGIDDAVLEFDLSTDVPQMLVLLFPTDTVSSNQLLYDVARHNFSSFVVKDFDLEQMNFGRLGMLLVKGFANMDELAHYRRVMEADKQLQLPPQVRPVMISVDNFNKLIQHGRSFEEYFRYIDDTVEERTEQAITTPDDDQQPQAPVEPQSPIPDAQLFDPTDQLR